MSAQASPPEAAPVCVMTKAPAAKLPAESALPALTPNHPNHRRQAPNPENRFSEDGVSERSRRRFPSTRTVTKAATPALR